MIRQELARGVDLQGVNLVKRNQLIPSGLGTRKAVELLGRGQEAAVGGQVSLLVGVTYVVPMEIFLVSTNCGVRTQDGGLGRIYQECLCCGVVHLGLSACFAGRAVTTAAPAMERMTEASSMTTD